MGAASTRGGRARRGALAVCVAAAALAALHRRFDDAFLHGARLGAWLLPRLGPGYAAELAARGAGRPDYGDARAWVALPGKADHADLVPPDSGWEDAQAAAPADCFFVSPSTYFGLSWNVRVSAQPWEINPLLWLSDFLAHIVAMVHATPYNAQCRVFAPKYRSVSGLAFLSRDRASVEAAMDVAFGDVLAAFQHMLAASGERPLLLVAHSQGSYLLARLLRQVIAPDPALRARLVVAHLLGAAITPDDVCGLPVCGAADHVGCVVGYNLFLRGGDATKFLLLPHDDAAAAAAVRDKLICVNSLTWRADLEHAPKHLNKGKGARPIPPHQVLLTYVAAGPREHSASVREPPRVCH